MRSGIITHIYYKSHFYDTVCFSTFKLTAATLSPKPHLKQLQGFCVGADVVVFIYLFVIIYFGIK